MNKKTFGIILFVSVICLACLRFIDIPVKKVLSEKVELKHLGNTVVLCDAVQTTGAEWKIRAMYNMPDGIDEIKLSFRNIPLFVKETYFYKNEFVFAGRYNGITNTFIVEKWFVVGDVVNQITRKESYRDNYLYAREFVPCISDYDVAYVSNKCVFY